MPGCSGKPAPLFALPKCAKGKPDSLVDSRIAPGILLLARIQLRGCIRQTLGSNRNRILIPGLARHQVAIET